MTSAMMIIEDLEHLSGSSPRSPSPRVTIRRMYASRRLFSRSVVSMAISISSIEIGMFNNIALADSYNLLRCSSSLNTQPLYDLIPSNTPSP